METDSIKFWCSRKFDDVVKILSTDNINIHVHAYVVSGKDEYIACDFFSATQTNLVADTTIYFGEETILDDLYSPKIKDVVVLLNVLEEISKKFNRTINFGMPIQQDTLGR